MTTQETRMTIRKAISVSCPVEHAFATFTDRIATWWPLGTHSIGEERAQTCVFEGRVGGRLYEIWDDGTECDWGAVTAWEPPHRIVFSWQPNPESPAPTEVELCFAAEGDGTRVEVEHRGWERLGDRAAEAYESYDSGWSGVLSIFAKAAAGA